MFYRIVKGALIFASAALAVPYTLALVGNILHGWPQCRNRYRRAFSPKKVFNYNYALYQLMRDRAKLVCIYLKMRKYYANADPQFLLKNFPYGRNECFLDLYLPKTQKSPESKLPVILFVYGGSWSSGDKDMYGLLCSKLVEVTNVIAVCPDYSYYPKGYVDDMIQDVVDCITWVIENIDQYGGDPNKVILMGHSAGAHLCAMSILEMLHDECTSVQQSFRFQPVDTQMDELNFAESYYGSQSLLSKQLERLEDSSGSSESFSVVSELGSSSENGTSMKLDSSQVSTTLALSTNSEGFTNVTESLFTSKVEPTSTEFSKMGQGERSDDRDNDMSMMNVSDFTNLTESLFASKVETTSTGSSEMGQGEPSDDKDKDISMNVSTFSELGATEPCSSITSESCGDGEEQDEDSGDNDSIVTVKPKDIEGQMTLAEVSKSVKAFIGLAGVYSISDHFHHEFSRGIEDVSKMARALYGVDHFDRFSPTQIVKRFGQFLSLPPVVLIHGTADYTVPVSSTSKFAEALAEIRTNVKVRIIPDAPHYDVMVDLMDKKRTFYSQIMSVVMETVNEVS